jgi:glycosyltransferase involved in cell wall biosynthesis
VKVIVQIPCLNEEATLPEVLRAIPREIPGVDQVETLVIDDGSSDRTSEVAREHGADHVLRFPSRRGLASAFAAGLDECLRRGADVIVNTDGDHQYPGDEIPRLVGPVLAGEADIVIGDRQTDRIEHFSWAKKRLQKLGSWVVRRLSGTRVPDATSGFRAISRHAALRMNVTSSYTYTLETVLQAGRGNLVVSSVPIRVNSPTRESRLISRTRTYVLRSALTLLRIYVLYKPLRFFSYCALPPLLVGLILCGRFLYFHFTQATAGHVQSLILAAVLLVLSFLLFVLGLVADLLSVNRQLLQDLITRMRLLDAIRSEDDGSSS